MNLQNLTGKWEGVYTYGPNYPIQWQIKKEIFAMDLVASGHSFTGSCYDSYTKELFNQPAIVEGTADEKNISFIKKYAAWLGINDNLELIVDWSKPSLEIHYFGILKRKLFSRKFFFEGSWSITDHYFTEQGEQIFYTSEGNWELYKIG